MFDNLLKNIQGFLQLTEDELAFFASRVEVRRFKKLEKLICQGDTVDYVYFIEKGILRYYAEIDGKEKTYVIFRENTWCSDYVAFLTREPATVSIEALENATVFQMHYNKMQEGYEKAKVFERFGRKIAESLFIEQVKRTSQMRVKSPEVRYLEMLEHDPEIINRVPLKYIASLLDIEPESLSRIRKRTARTRL